MQRPYSVKPARDCQQIQFVGMLADQPRVNAAHVVMNHVAFDNIAFIILNTNVEKGNEKKSNITLAEEKANSVTLKPC
jgi:hypothetical protein